MTDTTGGERATGDHGRSPVGRIKLALVIFMGNMGAVITALGLLHHDDLEAFTGFAQMSTFAALLAFSSALGDRSEGKPTHAKP